MSTAEGDDAYVFDWQQLKRWSSTNVGCAGQYRTIREPSVWTLQVVHPGGAALPLPRPPHRRACW